jgi:hypothetical protein
LLFFELENALEMRVIAIFYVFGKKIIFFALENMKLIKFGFVGLIFTYFSFKSAVCGKKL